MLLIMMFACVEEQIKPNLEPSSEGEILVDNDGDGFLSDEDCDDFSSLVQATKGWVILHSSTGSIFSNGEEEYLWNLPECDIINNVNVLGAGDIFASCFLYKLLGQEQDVRKLIEFAHTKTTEILKNLSQ